MQTENTHPPFTIIDLLVDAEQHRNKTADWSDVPVAIEQMQQVVTQALEYLLADFDYRSRMESPEAWAARFLALLWLQLDDFFPTEEVAQ